MEFKWRIFVVALIFTLALSALSGVPLFLFRSLGPAALMWLSTGTTVVGFLISPLLVFACFYLLGRKIDLKTEFLSVIVSLFLGNWIGHLLGYFSLQFLYVATYGGTLAGSQLLWFLWFVFRSAFSLEFFAGFSALSMAYMVMQRTVKTAV